jgi:cell shape-determining protein MreC
MQATYAADLAEYYEGDLEYEVGTVLVFGGDKEVTVTNTKSDTRVAGVVSDNAAFAMYEACPGLKNLVALQGRVPCKVVGKIRKGDILVTSGIAGVAVAAGTDIKVGTVVGKALKDYDSDHIGTLEIAVGRT